MIFNVRHELSSDDMAQALVLRAELEEGGEQTVEDWIKSRGKREVQQIVRERLGWSGDPRGWPEVEGERHLLAIARETCQRHWPGAA